MQNTCVLMDATDVLAILIEAARCGEKAYNGTELVDLNGYIRRLEDAIDSGTKECPINVNDVLLHYMRQAGVYTPILNA